MSAAQKSTRKRGRNGSRLTWVTNALPTAGREAVESARAECRRRKERTPAMARTPNRAANGRSRTKSSFTSTAARSAEVGQLHEWLQRQYL
jgi:hypothetical protein